MKSFGDYKAVWEDNKDPIIVDFYKKDEKKYSLIKNNYRTQNDNLCYWNGLKQKRELY